MKLYTKFAGIAVLAAAGLAIAAPAQAAFNVTYEAPGVQNSTASFSAVGVETFEGRSSGSFSTDFGQPGIFAGAYSGVQINSADVYGAAGGVGNYAVTFNTSGYTLDLSTSPTAVNYFGFWLSALDGGNQVSFYKAGSQVFSFNPGQVIALLSGNSAYYGNPNAGPFHTGNGGEPYVFLNFYDNGDTFDKVVFSENPQVGGYESDNHTVGVFTTKGGTELPAVPEPATWAMMLTGFGLVGMAARRQRRVALA